MKKSIARISTLALAGMLAAAIAGLSCGYGRADDNDVDDDGLIEISNLEQLNAVRWDLDGNGVVDDPADADAHGAAFPARGPGMGCPDSGCLGYELARSLDFDNGASYASGEVSAEWTSGAGWLPIGGSGDPFAGVFDGGGNTIANLFMDRPDRSHAGNNAGLFGGASGEVRKVGVVDVQVKAGNDVGGLVGFNFGAISESYMTGNVSGFRDSGGLAGINHGAISRSYAEGEVSGKANVGGGLVAVNYGSISDSHFKGKASVGTARVAGGLAALNFGEISGSYAEGRDLRQRPCWWIGRPQPGGPSAAATRTAWCRGRATTSAGWLGSTTTRLATAIARRKCPAGIVSAG